MTKQEKIKEGLISKIKSIRSWRNQPREDPLTAEDDVKDILLYLHSKGMVIKGEENPRYPQWYKVIPLIKEENSGENR